MGKGVAYSRNVQQGDDLPGVTFPAISRTTLALFAGASGDHNPIHIDIDYVRKAGLDDVFAHGMLSMAYLGQVVTRWAPADRLRHWGVRFLAITPVNAAVSCEAKVVEVFEAEGERRARIRISARTDAGVETLAGEAVVGLP
jgi:acyl dehydratase